MTHGRTSFSGTVATLFLTGYTVLTAVESLNTASVLALFAGLIALGLNGYERFRAIKDKSLIGQLEATQAQLSAERRKFEAEISSLQGQLKAQRERESAEIDALRDQIQDNQERIEALETENKRYFTDNLQKSEELLRLASRVAVQMNFLSHPEPPI